MSNNFREELYTKIEEINAIIDSFLPKGDKLTKTCIDTINYSVHSGGKRIRPLLMKETYNLFNGSNPAIKSFIAAIEFIHTSSLIHDDLPCMDNDEYRRGKKTTHIVYGEAIALLSGDELENYAYEIIANELVKNKSKETVESFKILSNKVGLNGMLGGQVIDKEYENKSIDLKTLNELHYHKTSALIEASMMIGAKLAKAKDEDVKKVEKIARCIGLAFQIQDDILDFIDQKNSSDNKNNKNTYVSLIGLENSKKEVNKLYKEAFEYLLSFNNKNEFLNSLINYLSQRKY